MKWTIVFLYVLVSPNLLAKDILRVEVDGQFFSQNQTIILFAGYHEIIFHFPENRKLGTKYSFRIAEVEEKIHSNLKYICKIY